MEGVDLGPGWRVKLRLDPNWRGPWPGEPLGVIEPILGEPYRLVDAVGGGEFEREYMVRFDEPQMDGDGDGPYRAAVIWGRYLQPVEFVGRDESPENLARVGRDDEALRAVIEHPERGQILPSGPIDD